jgi:hypothetical protein
VTDAIRITVAGPQGSGKSGVARSVAEHLVELGYRISLDIDGVSHHWSNSGAPVHITTEAPAPVRQPDPDVQVGLEFVADFKAVLDSPVDGFRIARPGRYRIVRDGDRVIFERFDAGDPYPWDTEDQESAGTARFGFSTRAVDCGMSVRTTALIRNRFGGDCTLWQLGEFSDRDLRILAFSEASITELRGVLARAAIIPVDPKTYGRAPEVRS